VYRVSHFPPAVTTLKDLTLKTASRIGCFAITAFFLLISNAQAYQLTYDIRQQGDAGNFRFGVGESEPVVLNRFRDTEISRYQVTGRVVPERPGLIGVSTGFMAAVDRNLEGFFQLPVPEQNEPLIEEDDGFVDPNPPPPIFIGWDTVSIRTTARGSFETLADIRGLSEFNETGFVRLDWEVTGTSNIVVDINPGFGGFEVNRATVTAALSSSQAGGLPDIFIQDALSGNDGGAGPDGGGGFDGGFGPDGSGLDGSGLDGSGPDGFEPGDSSSSGSMSNSFSPPPFGGDLSINDFDVGSLQQLSFLIPYDTSGLQPGDVPQIEVDFQLVIDANLEVTNATEFGGGFTADFDADFSNTATLTNVTVLDDSQVPIAGASVVDSFTGQGLVAVPEPSTAIMLIMAGCVGAAHRRRRTV